MNVSYFKNLVKSALIFFSVLGPVLFSVSAVGQSIPQPGQLVAYYPFSGNVNDQSDNNYNGALNGGPTLIQNRFSTANAAYSLDGVDDYIYFGNEMYADFPDINGDGYYEDSFTISIWAKSSVSDTEAFLAFGESAGLYTGMISRIGSSINFNSSNWGASSSTSGKKDDGEWHQYVLVYSAGSFRKIYIDGLLIYQGNDSQRRFKFKNYGVSVGVERFDPNGIPEDMTNTYTGSVDDVRIWNVALSSSDIDDLYSYENDADNDFVSLIAPTISNFNNFTKMYFDGSFSITDPTSNSTGGFTYTSDNASVATISGNTVTIIGAGTANITATQALDAAYSEGNSIVSLAVSSVSVVDKYGRISTTSANYTNKYGAIGGADGIGFNGETVLAKSSSLEANGLTADTASTSAYAIKQDFSSSTDGVYWISNSNINDGTPFQIYADMTTDGGGWILLNVGAGNYQASEASSLTSADALGYLPRTTVIELANLSTDVQLRAGNSSSSYAHKTTSTDPLAIGALKSNANDINGASTWANGASSTFVVNSGTWQWAYCCPGSATGWPRMYHSNNYEYGVHWFADLGMGRRYAASRDAWFSTWIR